MLLLAYDIFNIYNEWPQVCVSPQKNNLCQGFDRVYNENNFQSFLSENTTDHFTIIVKGFNETALEVDFTNLEGTIYSFSGDGSHLRFINDFVPVSVRLENLILEANQMQSLELMHSKILNISTVNYLTTDSFSLPDKIDVVFSVWIYGAANAECEINFKFATLPQQLVITHYSCLKSVDFIDKGFKFGSITARAENPENFEALFSDDEGLNTSISFESETNSPCKLYLSVGEGVHTIDVSDSTNVVIRGQYLRDSTVILQGKGKAAVQNCVNLILDEFNDKHQLSGLSRLTFTLNCESIVLKEDKIEAGDLVLLPEVADFFMIQTNQKNIKVNRIGGSNLGVNMTNGGTIKFIGEWNDGNTKLIEITHPKNKQLKLELDTEIPFVKAFPAYNLVFDPPKTNPSLDCYCISKTTPSGFSQMQIAGSLEEILDRINSGLFDNIEIATDFENLNISDLELNSLTLTGIKNTASVTVKNLNVRTLIFNSINANIDDSCRFIEAINTKFDSNITSSDRIILDSYTATQNQITFQAPMLIINQISKLQIDFDCLKSGKGTFIGDIVIFAKAIEVGITSNTAANDIIINVEDTIIFDKSWKEIDVFPLLLKGDQFFIKTPLSNLTDFMIEGNAEYVFNYQPSSGENLSGGIIFLIVFSCLVVVGGAIAFVVYFYKCRPSTKNAGDPVFQAAIL